MGDGFHLLDDRGGVIGDLEELVLDHQTALQLGVMRRDPRGAGVLVALQRLDTAQREHEPPRRGDEIRACTNGPGHIGRVHQLAAGDDADAFLQPVPVAQIDDPHQSLAQRHPHKVDQGHGGGPRATLAAIHRDEIGGRLRSARIDQGEQILPRLGRADHRLEPHRLARHLADMADHVQQALETVDIQMAIGRDTVQAHRNPPDRRDLGIHLLTGQDTALAGLGPLRQLQLEHLHLRMIRHRAQPFVAQVAMLVPHTVFGRADLIDDVAGPGQMKGRQPALARIQPDPRLGRPPAQRLDRRAGNRAVTHTRDVEDRLRTIRDRRRRPDDHRLRDGKLVIQRREHRVHEYRRAGDRQIPRRSEGHRIALPLGGVVNPVPLRPVEGHLLAVHGKEILPEEFAQRGEQMPEPPDHRIIPPHRIPGLHLVGDKEDHRHQHRDTQNQNEQQRQQQKRIHREIHIFNPFDLYQGSRWHRL